jgi:outer membrane protein OmpA-like peptidoglycan-associated protein
MRRLTQIWIVVLLLVGRYAVAEDVRYNFDFPDFETYVADAEQTPAEQAGDQHQPAEHTDSPAPVSHQQGVKVEGIIKARSGQNMILQTSQNPDLVVELTDTTDVGQVQGMLKARNKSMSMAALIPGLAVKVEGYRFGDRYIAQKVRFKGNDLKSAETIQAGMHETKMQAQENKEELEKQKAALEAQEKALKETQAQAAANKAAIDAAVARFGQLDDYYIFDEVTVYFDNGKVKVDPKYNAQLQALADKAKTINGYMIEVKGYASSSGSVSLNQKLSEDRANNVTNLLIQQSKIPLTRMLAPGAMGESEQVSGKTTENSEAENRRVVVRVLQNKAIAGI